MSRVLAVAVVAALAVIASGAVADPYFPPQNNVPACPDPSIHNTTLFYELLEESTQMPAQVGAQRVGVPFHQLVEFFNIPSAWILWNPLFKTNGVTNYSLCAPFDNVSYTNPPPVQPPFPSDLQAPHFIDQHGYDAAGKVFAFGWVFTLWSPTVGFLVFGRHTFTIREYIDQSGLDASTVESFEKAAGPQLDSHVNQVAWTIALQESLLDGSRGFVCLERVYATYGKLTLSLVQSMCDPFKP